MMNYSYFLAISNAVGKFFLPALAPVTLNISLIVACFLSKYFSENLLIFAVLLGGFLQVLISFYQVAKLDMLPKLTVPKLSKPLKQFLKKFLPASLSLGGFAVIGLLNLYFAAFLDEGAHTYIYYGDRLLELPKALIAVSLGVALLPSLSQLYNAERKEDFLNQSAQYRNILLFLSLPSAIGLYFLGAPLVEFLFLRGQFNQADVQTVAHILKIYSFLLVFSSLSRVLNSSFFASHNTEVPAFCVLISILFHASLAFYFTKTWGLSGLVTLTTLSGFVYFSSLLAFYKKFLGSLKLKENLKENLKILTSSLMLVFYLKFAFPTLSVHLPFDLALIFSILSSMLIYFLFANFIKVESFYQIKSTFQKKWDAQ